MQRVTWTLAFTLLTVLFLAPALLAQPNCPHGQGVTYISHDPQECLTLQFICVEGQVRFDSECGCGCMVTSGLASVTAPAELLVSGELPSPSDGEQPAADCELPEQPMTTHRH